MRRTSVFGVVLVVAAVGGWFWFDHSRSGKSDSGLASVADERAAGGARVDDDEADAGRDSLKPPTTGVRRPTYAPASSVEDWLQAIPADQRHIAAAFVARYPDAYRIESLEQQQWLVAHGFPTLEQVVAFRANPQPCPLQECANPVLAALHADRLLEDLETALASHPGFEPGITSIDALPEDVRIALVREFVASSTFTDRARDHGSMQFAAHLSARSALLRGDRQEVAEIRAFMAACGDERITDADSNSVHIMRRALGLAEGGRPCGYRPGRPLFPR